MGGYLFLRMVGEKSKKVAEKVHVIMLQKPAIGSKAAKVTSKKSVGVWLNLAEYWIFRKKPA
jgi:hypothetical protein